jgi:hypothetical protein
MLCFQAGKRLLLITNSDYLYTNKMMQYAFDKYLPDGMGWRSLFDMVRFSSQNSLFRVVKVFKHRFLNGFTYDPKLTFAAK